MQGQWTGLRQRVLWRLSRDEGGVHAVSAAVGTGRDGVLLMRKI